MGQDTRERIAVYLQSLESRLPEVLEEIEEEALREFVPIIRKESQSFLTTMITMKRPERILEIGTAVGFSALLMWYAARESGYDASITTIEYFEPRFEKARKNFRKAGAEDICFLTGDALMILPELRESYDLIFLDAAKGQYVNMLPDIKRLLAPGGVLITDNVLQEGDILESRYIIRQRDRTIHTRMREYLYAIKHDEMLRTSILPLGDGMALSVKKMF